MPISSEFKAAVIAQETDEVIIVLLTIDHEDIVEPIRVSSDSVDTVSRGNTFIPFPFEIKLPDSSDGKVSSTSISISNVDRRIVMAIREMTTGSVPPTVLIEIVLASDPDVLEAEFEGFSMTDAKYNKINVQASISQESFYHEPFPKDSFTPANFPGLF